MSPDKRKQLDKIMDTLKSAAAESNPQNAYKDLVKSLGCINEAALPDGFGFSTHSARSAGADAAKANFPKDVNPYPEQVPNHEAWNKGYDDYKEWKETFELPT